MAAETSQPVKAAIIAKHLSGERKNKIAADLGISKPTVYKVLDESQIDQYIQQTRSVFYENSPIIAESIVEEAKKNHSVGLELMDRTGILPKRSENAPSTHIAIQMNNSGLPDLK